MKQRHLFLHRFISCCAGLLFVFTGVLCSGPLHAADNVFLWKVRSERGSAYLLGSIHLARPELYPLDERIENAFTKSDRLVVEIDATMVDEAEATRQFLARGMYPEGEKLSNHIRPRTVNKLADLGVDIARVERMKPWFLATWLQAQILTQLGYDESLGIDVHFLRKAHERGMEIVELESFNAQLAMFERISDMNDDAYLYYSLEEMAQTERMTQEIVTAWKSGDAAALERIMFEPYRGASDYQAFLDVLFFDRNRAMTDRIDALLSDSAVSFVVVGAGHLVGDEGIVRLLKQRGHAVEQL